MNYPHIENLVLKAKDGDTPAKEALAFEFATLIQNLSRKTFVNSYEAFYIKMNATEHFISVLTFIMLTATALWPMLPMQLKTL